MHSYFLTNHSQHHFLFIFIETLEEFEQKVIKIQEGIKIAEKLGNVLLIRKAYKKVIMMTSSVGSFGIADHYYEKYIECLEPYEDVELSDIKKPQ